MSVSPKAKRKKEMTRKEVMEKLKQNENDISKAVQGLLEEMCPFDVNDEEALKIEGRLERLQKASHIFEWKLWHLKKQIKERKFRHNPELKWARKTNIWPKMTKNTTLGPKLAVFGPIMANLILCLSFAAPKFHSWDLF